MSADLYCLYNTTIEVDGAVALSRALTLVSTSGG